MTTKRPWLDDAARAALARRFDCPIDDLDRRLDAREAMEQQIAERREYEDPYGYERGRRY